MTIWPADNPPSARIKAVIRGKVALTDEDASIQSVCSRYIYEGAVELLAIRTLEGRRSALNKVPPLIRPHVEAEVMRIHKERRNR